MARRLRNACIGGAIVTLIGGFVLQTMPAHATTATQRDPAIGPHARQDAQRAQMSLQLTPARTSVVPRQPRVAARTVTVPAAASANTQLTREVFGYAPYWELSQNASWNYSLLTTVAYFGLNINGDGNFNTVNGDGTPDAGWTGWNSQALVDTFSRGHQAGTRDVLVIKQSNDATLTQLFTSSGQQTAINNVINAIASRGLDGVNVDFEGSSNPSYPNLQAQFTNFVGQLSSQVHQRWPGAFVSVATYSGSASWDGGFMNIGALAPNVDAFFIMAYDMAFGNMSGHAGPNAPLNGWTYNDTTSVAQYLTKAPASKIILGVPYYGYKWSTTSNQPYGSIVPGSGALADTYAGTQSDLSCGAQQLSQGWDGTAQSPWASWWSPATADPCGGNYNSWRELYYDNATSLAQKYDLVNGNNLRGTGMWALGFDGSSQDLWNEIATKFTVTYPFKAMHTLDAYGGVGPDAGSAPLGSSAYWRGWKIARSAAILSDASGGYVLDGYGGLHQFGGATQVSSSAYFGWDIARDVVLLPASTTSQPQGYTLDGWGGIHPFGGAPGVRGAPYWANFDIAKRLALLSDGTGGYVLDGYGGLHPFATGTNPLPPAITNASYWKGWNIARDLALTPGSTAAGVSGVTLDGWGGVHPFGAAGSASATAVWRGWDIARAVRLSPSSTPGQPQGWVMDGWGGMHPFGGVPRIYSYSYWPGQDIAVQLLVD
ncbi:MAG: chitinase [Chloroflexota bacterium]|jgi:spore germination protein YaaH|nr:chitinase [Chloroflexota bacterium]